MLSKNLSTCESSPRHQRLQSLKNLWNYRRKFIVEPFIFFFIMAISLNDIAVDTFPLDKACRVNLGYSKLVCGTILDKANLGLNCEGFSKQNISFAPTYDLQKIMANDALFIDTVCKAEIESQKLAANVSGKRAPATAIFLLIVLLFGGSWADRYNKLKPTMILPIIGQMLSFGCLLISAIFFDSVPMEFGAYLEFLLPAMCGGVEFCIVGVFSYITIVTSEEERTFRLGLFAMFHKTLFLIGQSVSGILFEQLGYILSFSMALLFQSIALLYVVFYIDEIDSNKTEDDMKKSTEKIPLLNESVNFAYEIPQLDDIYADKNMNVALTTETQDPLRQESAGKCSLVKEFFDPTLVKDLYDFSLIKREQNGRLLLLLLILAYFLIVGPEAGESDFWFRYVVLRFGWNGKDYSLFETTASIFSLIGTFIGTVILSRKLKFSDPMIGILATLSVIFAHIIWAFSTNTLTFYIGAGVEMFSGLCSVSVKTIGASIVADNELSKMYSVFGISEPIGQFIFTPLFSEVYSSSVDGFKGAWLLVGEMFYIPKVLVFILCYFILRSNRKNIKSDAVGDGQNEATATDATSFDAEITNFIDFIDY